MIPNGFVIQNGVLEKYIGTDKKIRIPDGVLKIGERAFAGRQITDVLFPDGLEIIGAEAFCCCTFLEGIMLPSSVIEIGDSAFYGCHAVKSLRLGERLCRIGRCAFSECTCLPEAEIRTVPESMGTGIFRHCTSLERCKLPEGMTKIPDSMFCGCKKLKDIDIPSSVTVIGGFAFNGCSSLERVEFPSCVTEIGQHAFEGCSKLREAELPPELVVIGDFAFAETQLYSAAIPGSVKVIGCCAFRYIMALESIFLSEGLTEICPGAFSYCGGLEAPEFPKSLKRLGRLSFAGCVFGDSATLPEGVSELENIFGDLIPEMIIAPGVPANKVANMCKRGALLGFTKEYAKGRRFPEELTESYVAYARRARKKLYKLSMKHTYLIHFMINKRIIPPEDISFLLDITAGDVEITAALLKYKSDTVTPRMEEKMRREEDELLSLDDSFGKPLTATQLRRLFSTKENPDGTLTLTSCKCTDKHVEIPAEIGGKRITAIGELAFSPRRKKCTDKAKAAAAEMVSVVIPEGIEVIGECAFWMCEKLSKVTIPLSVREIGMQAFRDCTRLSGAEFITDSSGARSTVLHNSVFMYSGLADITLPKGCKLDGVGHFWRCDDLITATLPEDLEQIPQYTFGLCSSLSTVTVPGTSTSFYRDTFCGNSSSFVIKTPKDSAAALDAERFNVACSWL